MFPLWDVAIAPVLEAARVRRVVEIGALRGETTVKMLHDLGPDAVLHVIDPVPDFDPSEHERQFAGRYYFHEYNATRSLIGTYSLNVAKVATITTATVLRSLATTATIPATRSLFASDTRAIWSDTPIQ